MQLCYNTGGGCMPWSYYQPYKPLATVLPQGGLVYQVLPFAC
jgi:hypothetical protein